MRRRVTDLSVGQVAARSGPTVATVHFYEKIGLIRSYRDGSNYRRFHRGVLRRLAIIRVAQRVGLSLSDIETAFGSLPHDDAIDVAAWRQLSSQWAQLLGEKIRDLEHLRDELGDCIGCGCLSLDKCQLYNPDDCLSSRGSGARLWAEDASAC